MTPEAADWVLSHIGFTLAVYAVLRTPRPATDADEFTALNVDDNRHLLGAPDPDQDTGIRKALSALAERRRADARQVEHNRVHILGRDPVPPICIGHTAPDTYIVHVRCSCPQVEGLAAHFEHVSQAAADWLDEIPTTPWKFCPTSPTRVTGPSGSGRLTRTLRNAEGAAVVELQHADGHREAVALAEVSDLD
ncbi:hypothetical protein [Streptomyces botrytidirepellens]|uniref:Uncharacterized protein n=1 Tax=Streptomyces botrytidirepellens TaxID=2486417 RepID=A0A3M8WNK7_9ACTN|nr:hypothetical protein [Streptomyces botrytidirepellens]RNG30341.1 hypothetical protein EEJ42_10890 [Streptomyces botrytidirepellens]